jgi:flagellar hook protein FlgE
VSVPPSNVVSLSATVYDTVGNPMAVNLTFTRGATVAVPAVVGPPAIPAGSATTWTVVASGPAGATPPYTVAANTTTLVFNGDGKVVPGAAGAPLVFTPGLGTGAGTSSVTLDLSSLTQLSATSDMSSNTDGASAGTLTTFSVGAAGGITGIYSNGYKQPLGQIALASFANPGGLMKAGGNLFTASPNSGVANIGMPDSGGRGMIATGFLEGSNVDLAQQFTNMIMAERGFQANSRVITTSDEILQDLVNIKR